jgi:hypothetical protein
MTRATFIRRSTAAALMALVAVAQTAYAQSRVQYGRITANSSTGNALVGTYDSGETDDGIDIPASFLAVDPNNTTDATLGDLLRGLHDNNLTTKTAYSSADVTSTLTHKGKQSIKLEITERDNAGGANITTQTCTVKSLERADMGGKGVWNPVFNVISVITPS